MNDMQNGSKIVFLFPGQGSQYVGMGKDFYENYAVVRDLFDRSSDILDMDMKRLCFEGPGSELVKTQHAQPAVTLVNIAAYRVLQEEGVSPSAAAGHSLGEYSALYAAGALEFADLMELVKWRARFMSRAAGKIDGGMLAVIGLKKDVVADLCKSAGSEGHLEIANVNAPEQIIVSGEKKAIEKMTETASAAGAKLTMPLAVSGAWHTGLMAEAGEEMACVLEATDIRKPSIPVVANVTADFVDNPKQIKTVLKAQITSPVLWTASIERLISDGFELFVEAGPKRALTGLMGFINKGVRVYNVENVRVLKRFLETAIRAQ